MLRAGGEERVLRDEAGGERRMRLPVGGSTAGASRPLPAGATEAAWVEFHRRLRSFVVRRVGSAHDADDVVQQVFLRMHRSLETLRNGEGIGAWLHRTARNAIADHYRAPARRRETLAGDTRELDRRQAPSPWDEPGPAANRTCAGCLRPLIDLLPAAYRRAIELVELQGSSQSAAARAEGLSLSGMKTRVQRARQRLKTMLAERCRVSLDARGGVLGCEPRGQGGGPCAAPETGVG